MGDMAPRGFLGGCPYGGSRRRRRCRTRQLLHRLNPARHLAALSTPHGVGGSDGAGHHAVFAARLAAVAVQDDQRTRPPLSSGCAGRGFTRRGRPASRDRISISAPRTPRSSVLVCSSSRPATCGGRQDGARKRQCLWRRLAREPGRRVPRRSPHHLRAAWRQRGCHAVEFMLLRRNDMESTVRMRVHAWKTQEKPEGCDEPMWWQSGGSTHETS
jgi:hypothetical protein